MTGFIQQVPIGRTDLCCRWEVCSKNPRENLVRYGYISPNDQRLFNDFRYVILQRFVSWRSQPDTHSYKSSPAFHDVPIMDSKSSFSSRPNFDRLRKKRAQLCAARNLTWLLVCKTQQKVSAFLKYHLFICETLTVYLFNNTLQKTDLAMILL